jgi:hypothetical protein
MATHKFRVGERVQYLAGTAVRFATAEVYEIVQPLPESYGEYQYKIKSAGDPHLRARRKASCAGCRSCGGGPQHPALADPVAENGRAVAVASRVATSRRVGGTSPGMLQDPVVIRVHQAFVILDPDSLWF